MSDVGLIITLVVLVLLSGFFSSSETAMMALNRYRIRHLAKDGNRIARVIVKLLERPDRLLSVILIGNTFANILASSIATVLAVKWFGDMGVVLATIVLTFVILIFAEITPKTFAATHPQGLAFCVAWPLIWLQKILYPFVWLSNMMAVGLLRLVGVRIKKQHIDALSREELQTLVRDAGQKLSGQHQEMLLGTLELTDVTVEDIMLPRGEIIGIDLTEDMDEILEQLSSSQHTRLPVFEGSLDNMKGMLHMRKVLHLIVANELTKENMTTLLSDIYFVPETTSLNVQLLNFQQQKQRTALVVDEYGEIQGLITLEDILEEIVGEFTTDADDASPDVHKQDDGSYVVDGTITIRELNRSLKLDLPTDGPKTLSGAIIEYMEMIPEPHTSLKLHDIAMEIMQVKDNLIKSVKFKSP